MSDALIFINGFTLGLGLIIAIGAQNAFVLRQGVRGQHAVTVASVSAFGDIVLILAGAAGMGAVILALPWLKSVFAWGGAAFLLVYGYRALRACLAGATSLDEVEGGAPAAGPTTTGQAVVAALGFSLLNPHAYLDTVVVLGSVSAQYSGLGRFVFAGGAVTASIVWFYLLIAFGRLLAPILRTRRAARILDGFVWLVMWAVAANLIAGEVWA